MKQETRQAKREKLWIDALERKLDKQGLLSREQAAMQAQAPINWANSLEDYDVAIADVKAFLESIAPYINIDDNDTDLALENDDYEQAEYAVENLETSESRFFERLFKLHDIGFTSYDIYSVYRERLRELEAARYRRDRIRPDDRLQNHSVATVYTRASLPIDILADISERHAKFKRDKIEQEETLAGIAAPLMERPIIDKYSAKYDDLAEYDSKQVVLTHLGFYKPLKAQTAHVTPLCPIPVDIDADIRKPKFLPK